MENWRRRSGTTKERRCWQHAYLEQELFDAVFNYFPITFRPPPDDPYGITAQDLKDRLRECISSTPDFAPYAFPALLDKLDSTSMNTKVRKSHVD
jgi:DNA repair/transcription protein MET18/MMS19